MARDGGRRIRSAEVVALPAQSCAFPWASAAARGPTRTQWIASTALIGVAAVGTVIDPARAVQALHWTLLAVFALAASWRALAVGLARPAARTHKLTSEALPRYTVIAPLYREADMVPGLTAALAAIDYPRDRLQILIVLEADDEDTLSALHRIPSPGLEILIAPPGAPRTKPRACNIALAAATGERVVVYDAEDRPHPLQLKEAAARFAETDPRLACLQAPLRIHGARGFIARQFALEYAAQFEVTLPALARLGLPFPLGGTSNHFRTDVLRKLGGWDAWNVTEDADLGFRLAAGSWRTGLLRAPTWESAPTGLSDWTPQRARWIKGYMQSWGVHMRAPHQSRFRRMLALQITLGLSILSALAHGPVMLLLIGEAALTVAGGRAPGLAAPDFALLTGGWGAAILAMSAGSRRTGRPMRLRDATLAPLYWMLQSFAAALAIRQLCTRPHHWDKTPHAPLRTGRLAAAPAAVALDEKGEASVRRAA